MKLTSRYAVWALPLVFTIAMLATPMTVAAQSEQGLEHGRGQDRNRDYHNTNNPNYQQGWNHGQEDRAGNRSHHYRVHPDNDADRRAYESGYDQGYRGNGSYQGQNGNYGERNGQYGNDGRRNGPYRNGTYGTGSTQSAAYNNGFQTGLTYGEADHNNGHSNRPTFSSTYQNGTKGYNSSYGSQTAYKSAFRQGYQDGYARGYTAGNSHDYRR